MADQLRNGAEREFSLVTILPYLIGDYFSRHIGWINDYSGTLSDREKAAIAYYGNRVSEDLQKNEIVYHNQK